MGSVEGVGSQKVAGAQEGQSKGQIISEWLSDVFIWTKIWTKTVLIIMLISDYLSSNIIICILFWFDLF